MTRVGPIFRQGASRLRAARMPVVYLFLLGSLVGIFGAAWSLAVSVRQNSVIARLADGHDIAVDPATASTRLLMARHYSLITLDRLDEAQIFADVAAPRASSHMCAQIFYNLGNARVRQAFDLIEKGDLDKAGAMIGLAKSNYRAALKIEPKNWDVKHNLDVAQRLVRDLPRESVDADDEPPPSKKAKPLWTDLPGLPRGLP